MQERLQLRVTGDASRPTLIYLPGLHGDWTLVRGFKHAVSNDFRFVEFTYPRTLEWSLDDYAAAIEQALLDHGIGTGWLIGESFGSQLVWSILKRKRFPTQGIILAGGFVKHPFKLLVRVAERIAGGIPLSWITRVLFAYAKISRFRHRKCPAKMANLDEFIARRTELDRQAAKHRLRLIAHNDPGPIACKTDVPVYALTGAIDLIVPWFWTRKWLRRNCPALRDYQVIWPADHTILSTAPDRAARQIAAWIQGGAPGKA